MIRNSMVDMHKGDAIQMKTKLKKERREEEEDGNRAYERK
jgi:hypothetical protein